MRETGYLWRTDSGILWIDQFSFCLYVLQGTNSSCQAYAASTSWSISGPWGVFCFVLFCFFPPMWNLVQAQIVGRITYPKSSVVGQCLQKLSQRMKMLTATATIKFLCWNSLWYILHSCFPSSSCQVFHPNHLALSWWISVLRFLESWCLGDCSPVSAF